VTLVVTVNGRESIWLLADRRLSYPARPPKDDARKVMFLKTVDGTAILGYAGLGATALGTEPSDWISAVLRGVNLPLEQSLGVLAEAMKRQLPKHLMKMPGAGMHVIAATAFLGNEAMFYTIDLACSPDRKHYDFRYTHHGLPGETSAWVGTPRITAGGSGALHLSNDRDWVRNLLPIVRASDRGKVTANAVSDHLARLNNQVYLRDKDKSVGPSCIVAWRHREGGIHNGGGGHQFYTGTSRDSSSPFLPTISNGLDVHALIGVFMPHVSKHLEALKAGADFDLDKDQLNVVLAQLPDTPDESLR
jgi:hypothetical protein